MAAFSPAELSLRHLPELSIAQSNTTFQIPVEAANSSGFLLDNENESFLGGVDFSFGTPAVPKIHHTRSRTRSTPKHTQEPPQTSQLHQEDVHLSTSNISHRRDLSQHERKKPIQEAQIPDAISKGVVADPISKTSGAACVIPELDSARHAEKSKKSETDMTKTTEVRAEASRRGVRSTRAATQVQLERTRRETRSESIVPKEKPDMNDAQPVQRVRGEDKKIPITQAGDISMSSALDGVAGRLFMYGQNMVFDTRSSDVTRQTKEEERLANPAIEPERPRTRLSTRRPSAENQKGDPLTLSQLKPKRKAVPPQAPAAPARASTKRPASPTERAPDSAKRRKKIVPSGAEEKRVQPKSTKSAQPAKSKPVLRSSRQPQARTATRGRRSVVPNKENTTRLNASNSSSESATLRGSRDPKEPKATMARSQASEVDHAPKLDRSAEQNTAMSSLKPTKPIEFQFQMDLRSKDRKPESEDKMKTRQKSSVSHPSVPALGFKAIHGAQGATLAASRHRKITPTIPIPIEFATDVRVREREKFEEGRRAREQELERQMEERRRQQELEEEMEIRELRKRAVPKANAVPEWYADAPKKTGSRIKSQ